jgi:hypothetical protein
VPTSCPLCAMCSRLVTRHGRRTLRRSPRCRCGRCSLGAPRVLRASRDVLTFSQHRRCMTRRLPWCRRGGCSLGAPHVLRARRDVLAFGCSAGVTHDAEVTAVSLWRLLPGSSALLRACRDVLAFGRLAQVMHDAQVVQVAAMSSWWLLPGSSVRSSCPPRCAHVR